MEISANDFRASFSEGSRPHGGETEILRRTAREVSARTSTKNLLFKSTNYTPPRITKSTGRKFGAKQNVYSVALKEFTPSVVCNSAGVLRCSLNGGSGVEIEIDRQLSVSSHFSDLLVVNCRHDCSPD
jgi:hypothetical protein